MAYLAKGEVQMAELRKPCSITRLNWYLVVMTLPATLDHQSSELDSLEIPVDVDVCITTMVAVNPDISSETVSNRLVEEWQ